MLIVALVGMRQFGVNLLPPFFRKEGKQQCLVTTCHR